MDFSMDMKNQIILKATPLTSAIIERGYPEKTAVHIIFSDKFYR